MSIVNTLFGGNKKTAAPTKTVGVGGAKVYGGYVHDKEKDSRLQGTTKFTTYSEMLSNCSIVAAATRYFLNLAANAQWKVNPADDTQAAKDVAEFIEAQLNDMDTPWTRVIRKSAMYRYYGYGLQEWTAKRLDDGRVGMRDVSVRPQSTIERWDINEDTSEIYGVVQRAPISSREIYIPRKKLVYIVDDALNDSPEGLGLFRNVVDSATRLKRFETLEAFGFEGDLRGIPVARIPYAELEAEVDAGNMSAAQRDTLISSMENFLAAHIKANPNISLAMDSSVYKSETDTGENPSSTPLWDFSLLEGNSRGQVEVAAAIERINLEIARVLGVEQLLLGNGEGSQALSRDKSHNFAMIVDSTLTDIAEAFNADYVRQICRLNGFDKELWPELCPERQKWQDIQAVTGALRDMAQAGAIMSPDDPAINDVRQMLGVSDAPEYDEENMLLGGAGEDDASMEGEVSKVLIQKWSYNPVYASRRVENARDLIKWAESQGFEKVLTEDDFHVTVAFSRTPIKWKDVSETAPSVTIEDGTRSVSQLGDEGAIVLHIESDELQQRWQEYIDNGASWDYDGYRPHVTITYDGASVDLSKVTPFTGKIILGPEKKEALQA